MKTIIAIFTTVLLGSSLTANANGLLSYSLAKQGWELGGEAQQDIKIYLNGLANGISFANSMQEFDGNENLFCPPSHLTLDGELLYDMGMGYAEDNEVMIEKDAPIALLALKGLYESFPCS